MANMMVNSPFLMTFDPLKSIFVRSSYSKALVSFDMVAGSFILQTMCSLASRTKAVTVPL